MMMKQQVTISEYPAPDSLSTEIQVIADIISLPGTLTEAERLVTPSMFANDRCRAAYEALRKMASEGITIDLPSAFGKIDRDLMLKDVTPMMVNTGGPATAVRRFATLRDFSIKRKCYFRALDIFMGASGASVSAQDLIGRAGQLAEELRKEMDANKGTQHISAVINDLGTQIEDAMKHKAEGKVLRTPTGLYTLDFLTYGGFNAGNLVILAARPSVGKTAIMLQMAKAAAYAGKTVNLFSLEMTNTELAQRFLFSTGKITPLQVTKGEVVWQDFEDASSEFTSKPIYLNDSVSKDDEIISRITLDTLAGRCDIAFIDYLGLIGTDGRLPLREAIASVTKRLKNTAKSCGIPIVLLCQLNRASASEKRAPQLYDLRDSGSIEQDADIVLMLERNSNDEEGRDIDMWVRKNRQGRAGDVKVELTANDTFTAFTDKGAPQPPPVPLDDFGNIDDFDNDDIPF